MKQTTLGGAATDEDGVVVYQVVDLDGANVNDDQFSSAEEYPDYNLVHVLAADDEIVDLGNEL